MGDEPKSLQIAPKSTKELLLDLEFLGFLLVARARSIEFNDEEMKEMNALKPRILAHTDKFEHGNAEEKAKAREEFDKIKDEVVAIVAPKHPDNPEGAASVINGLYVDLIKKYESINAAREKEAQAKKAPDAALAKLLDSITDNVADTHVPAEEIAERLKKLKGADQNADGNISFDELTKKLSKLNSVAVEKAFKKAGPEGFIKTDIFEHALENTISAVSQVTSLPAKPKVTAAASK